jgi:uncharacterized protein (TIGR02145 family)
VLKINLIDGNYTTTKPMKPFHLIQLTLAILFIAGNLSGQDLEIKSNELNREPSKCDLILDKRDGKTYATVQIGKQCWMAQNLDFGTFIPLSSKQSLAGVQKYCYRDNPDNCSLNGYGGLYVWDEIMNGQSSCNGYGAVHPACKQPVQGICPDGWHVPSHDEFTLLEKTVGTNPDDFPYDNTTRGFLGKDEGANLKSTRFDVKAPAWYNGGTDPIRGTNLSGFNALQTGAITEGEFSGFGYFGSWMWTSTEFNQETAWRRMVYYNFSSINRNAPYKTNGNSLRCVQNELIRNETKQKH